MIIFVSLNNHNMDKAELEIVEQSEQVSLYSIRFNGQDKTEFERFLQTFKDNAELNGDFQRIVYAVSRILANGVLERYFRPEGGYGDGVCAVPIESGQLRLYCLRMSDQILIIGNGGIKTTRTTQEDPLLQGYVITLQKFDRLIRTGIRNGVLSIEEKEIVGSEGRTFQV